MFFRIGHLFYRFLINLSKLLIGPTLEVGGLENLPKKEGFIIAANHVSSLDQFAIVAAIKKFLVENFIKKEKKLYFVGMLALKKRIYSFFINEDCGYLPSTKQGINQAVKLLKKGNIVGIFPEGRRNSTVNMLPGKKGVAFMALLSGAPVIPVACFAPPTFSFYQGLRYFFISKKLIFGSPIKFFPEAKSQLLNNSSLTRSVTDIIMLEIAKLCDKKYGP